MDEIKPNTEEDTSPFKVLKLDNGDDVICKILHEYSDAVVVERPMAIAETPQFNEQAGEVITHTGLTHWMNFTNDIQFAISKTRIIAVGNLAPEVGFYYKHICKKLALREDDHPKDEAEIESRIKRLDEIMKNVNVEEGDKTIIEFPLDRTKLH